MLNMMSLAYLVAVISAFIRTGMANSTRQVQVVAKKRQLKILSAKQVTKHPFKVKLYHCGGGRRGS